MKITMITLGSTGDVRPYMLLGRELHERGHEVTIAAFAPFQGMIEEAGMSFYPISGDVVDMTLLIGPGLKVPHIGWNVLDVKQPVHPLLAGVRKGDCVYFVHSFCATRCDESVIATAEYGAPLTAAVARGNVLGCQFHPEKSGEVGLRILRAFCTWGR